MEGKIKTKGRRLLVMFAVLLAVTALMCVSAFAEGEEASITRDGEEVLYQTFAEAVNGAQNGETIKLLKDVSIGDQVYIWKEVTVDGTNGDNKFTITLSRSAKNTTGIYIQSSVTFENVIVTITGQQIDYGAFEVCKDCSLTLVNSEIKDAAGTITGAVRSYNTGSTFKMINSKITGASATYVAFKGVAVAFSKGGTFEMDAKSSISNCTGTPTSDAGVPNPYVVAVYGGTGSVKIDGSITNGTKAVGVYVGTGVTCDTISAVCSIDGADSTVYYWDLGAEIKACKKNNRTIKLLKDVDLTYTAVGEETYTLDGQGHTLYLTKGYTLAGDAARVTLRNVTVDLSKYTDTNRAPFISYDGSSLTLDNGAVIQNYTAKTDNPVILVQNKATVTLNTGSKLTELDSSEVTAVSGLGIKTHSDNAAGATININGGEISNATTAGGGGNKGAAIYLPKGTINMTGGMITGCQSLEGGAIYVGGNGTFNMTGGEITGNYSWSGSGVRAATGARLNISGNAKVYNNIYGNKTLYKGIENIRANTADTLYINGAFTGKIGFVFDGCDRDNNNAGKNVLDTKIGTIANGLTLASDSIVCDYDNTLFAYVSNGELILKARPVLTAVTETGRYTKSNDSAKYGVVRVNTTVNKASNVVEEIGTYFYKTTNNGSSDVATTGSNYVKITDMSKFANGNGYTADVVDITEDATVYAVNFYKHSELGYLFESPVKIDFVRTEAKNLGEDPEQLR